MSALIAQTLKILPSPFEWCFVPSGEVTLETDPPKTYTIPDFAIAKYTITNAQFQVFLDAKDGYMAEKEFHWFDFSENARNYRLQNAKPQMSGFKGENLPRGNVSWFVVMAFCRWLSNRVGQMITLPTEQQWQRAAVGDTGWAYPWGDEFDAIRCCHARNSNGEPAVVTDYEIGNSPYNVVQMSGNVWEWCAYDDSMLKQCSVKFLAHTRAMRGGSYLNTTTTNLRATCRNRNIANLSYRNIGFRIALPKISPSDSPQSPLSRP